MANYQNSLSTLAPASIDKSASSPAGIMSPGLGPAELLRNCLQDWAPSGANNKLPPGLGPGSFLKKLQWGPVFLCQIEYGNGALVTLGSLDRDTRQLGGLSVSGLPVAKSKFERNVYIYDCLQHIG